MTSYVKAACYSETLVQCHNPQDYSIISHCHENFRPNWQQNGCLYTESLLLGMLI